MIRIPTHRPPTHPGEMLLAEFLTPMGLSQRELAEALHVPYQRINEIINGRPRGDAEHGPTPGEVPRDVRRLLGEPANALGSVSREARGVGGVGGYSSPHRRVTEDVRPSVPQGGHAAGQAFLVVRAAGVIGFRRTPPARWDTLWHVLPAPLYPGAARPAPRSASLATRPPRTALPAFAHRLTLRHRRRSAHFGQILADSARNCPRGGVVPCAVHAARFAAAFYFMQDKPCTDEDFHVYRARRAPHLRPVG
jgi:hypothetical protein